MVAKTTAAATTKIRIMIEATEKKKKINQLINKKTKANKK